MCTIINLYYKISISKYPHTTLYWFVPLPDECVLNSFRTHFTKYRSQISFALKTPVAVYQILLASIVFYHLHFSLLPSNLIVFNFQMGHFFFFFYLSIVLSCKTQKIKGYPLQFSYLTTEWELNKKTLAFCPLVSNWTDSCWFWTAVWLTASPLRSTFFHFSPRLNCRVCWEAFACLEERRRTCGQMCVRVCVCVGCVVVRVSPVSTSLTCWNISVQIWQRGGRQPCCRILII